MSQKRETTDSRREFFKKAAGIALTAGTLPLLQPGSQGLVHAASAKLDGQSPLQNATNEQFWSSVRGAFDLSPQFINFESGYYSPQPDAGVDEVGDQARRINELAAFYMRGSWLDDVAGTTHLLARFTECAEEEILITRNTTESLNIVIMGLDLKAGDEAVWGRYEYGSMQVAFKQRAAREGIVNKTLDIPINTMSDDKIVKAYQQAITARTKVILVSHIVYLTGQVLPVRRICDMAHERGVEVIIDGAHSFAHLADKITDLHGDYYGTSLHKWMMAPIGTGLLYVRREKIKKLWPLFGDWNYATDKIRKLGHFGTCPPYLLFAIAEAVRFNQAIGLARKEARLRYIKNYWVTRLAEVRNIIVHTPTEDHRSCAMTAVGIKDKDPGELAKILYERYQIFTVSPGYPGAVRVCPNIYSSIGELDRFVAAMKELAAES
jgi:selenocysteine lyase/cysteine desulfurase